MIFLALILLLSCHSAQEPIKHIGVQRSSANTSPEKSTDTDKLKLEQIEKIFKSYIGKFPSAVNINPLEAQKLIKKKNSVIVDVREKAEYQVSMLEGAITKKDFEENIEKYKDKNILVYCTIGYRSGLYTQKLIKKKLTAYNLKGGVLLWSHYSLPFYKSGKITNKVHVYGNTWNYLHSNYVAVD